MLLTSFDLLIKYSKITVIEKKHRHEKKWIVLFTSAMFFSVYNFKIEKQNKAVLKKDLLRGKKKGQRTMRFL